MEYNFNAIDQFWLDQWAKDKVYEVSNTSDKPKYYVLEMFPYPSGAGLHVGHPLGYIASDIFARYKRLKGFNVLHPMGFDAFGLPAEQYAIETGQHPAVTTKINIARYKDQLKKIGLSYDWSREYQTNDPAYYKWTQWIFLQLFNAWYNPKTNKAATIDTLLTLIRTTISLLVVLELLTVPNVQVLLCVPELFKLTTPPNAQPLLPLPPPAILAPGTPAPAYA